MSKRVLLSFLTLLLLVGVTTLVVFYGKGYRLIFNQERLMLAGTGLLVATSTPDGASIYLNSKLTSATNTTLNLPPGTYDVRIVKEGYLSWEKKLTVQEQVVTKAQAFLLPQAPKLESLSSSGVNKPILDPTLTRIAFTVDTSTPKKNGIYVLDMAGRPILTLQNAATLLADDTFVAFSKSLLSWSPSGKELIASVSSQLVDAVYVLNPDSFNREPEESLTIDAFRVQWEKEQEEKERARIASLPPVLSTVMKNSFSDMRFAPDDTRLLYTASQSATIPKIISPSLPGSNSQPEDRNIQKGKLYVYDVKEDKNFLIGDKPKTSSFYWMADSLRLLYVEDKKVKIVEYDGTNKTVVYAGPFDENFVAPWPDGSRIVILTNLGAENIQPNLYTISLR